VVHVLTVSGLAALVVVQVLKWVFDITQHEVLVMAAIAAAAAFAYLYSGVAVVAEWARYTAVLPAIAVGLFLLSSSSSDLLRGPQSLEVGSDDAEPAPPVVFVLLDELPTKTLLDADDEIDRVRYPNLAGFADDATWYRHFTTVAPFSNQAIPAILTGSDPEIVEPLWTEYPDNLFSLLAPTHDLSVLESFTKLCGVESCTEGPPGSEVAAKPRYGDLARTAVDLWIDRISFGPAEPPRFDDFNELASTPSNLAIHSSALPFAPSADELRARPQRLQQFLDALEPSDDPALYFAHLVLPHSPFRFYPDGTIYDAVLGGGSGSYPNTQDNGRDWPAAFNQQRHIFQTRYVDGLVGDVMSRLRETGLYDEALVVVAADHGASFRAGTPFRTISSESLDAIAYSPLLIKAPGQTSGVIDDSNLMGIDVVPTIAHLLDIEVPFAVDGAPAGSPEIVERGGKKRIYDLTGSMSAGISLAGVVEFDDAVHFPSAADRWIPPAIEGDYPMAGLLRPLGFDDLRGRSLDEVSTGGPVGEVEIQNPAAYEKPSGPTMKGWVQGKVDGAPDDAVVVVEVNGKIVSASALYENDGSKGHFAALLPPGVLGAENRVRVGVQSGEELVERTIKRG
jgi:arylsulfatase A-like enzyme